ncbi:MAG: DnaD domain-containing protein [Thermoflavifilum sp.]|nr:DnaD domain-containing protein [Thermoflavifilum sp.]MCL6513920.1 DnaD domain-containing protein [Alicyclobacillus sp.]
MRPAEREGGGADFLTRGFVSVPRALLDQFPELGISAEDFVVLLQILSAQQLEGKEFLSPYDLSVLCSTSPTVISEIIGRLVARGLLAIGERLDDDGTRSNYFDLKPLWQRLRGRDPQQPYAGEWRKDPVTLFEEEFGRPLSALECEQIRRWLDDDAYPEWLITEALREAVLANKFSFRYIDRILYEWQRHRIRTRQELEQYRQQYRAKRGGATDPDSRARSTGARTKGEASAPARDERYKAFYDLFPDA